MAMPTSWDELVASLGPPPPGSIAESLARETPDLAAPLREFTELVLPSTNASSTALAVQTSNAEPGYFLTVSGGKIVVMHHLREVVALNATGGRYAALSGDRRMVSETAFPPSLYSPANVANRTAFLGIFQTWPMTLRSWDGIQTMLVEDADMEYVTRPEAVEGTPAPEQVNVMTLLPIPPHLALLHMEPRSEPRAFALANRLRAIIPATAMLYYSPYLDFLRGAVTESEADGTISALETGWDLVDIDPGSSLESYHGALLARVMPSAAAPTPPVAPPPLPTPPEAQEEASSGSDRDRNYFAEHELQRILLICGVDHYSDAPRDELEAALPEFWAQFAKFRGSNTKARNWLDQHWNKHQTQRKIRIHFALSRNMVECLRTLDFCGGDMFNSYAKRARGLSFFSLGPARSTSAAEVLEELDSWTHFERADEDRRVTLKEHEAADASSTWSSACPEGHMDMMMHLDVVVERLMWVFTGTVP